ncbi:Mobile element protein [Chitinispirillum alkaliphilum]|nr:Mobile element protein [Chitinispirillum alkaliphilum]
MSPVHWYDIIKRITGKDPLVCQECKKGRMVLIAMTGRRKQLILIQEGIP